MDNNSSPMVDNIMKQEEKFSSFLKRPLTEEELSDFFELASKHVVHEKQLQELKNIKKDSELIEQHTALISELNKEIADLKQQLKGEAEKADAAVKKEHRFALKSSIICACFSCLLSQFLNHIQDILNFITSFL